MLTPTWRTRLQSLERKASSTRATPRLPSNDDAEFIRDWQRLRALHLRFGLPFSLLLIRASDAIRRASPLSQSASQRVGERIIGEVGDEDSVLHLGHGVFAVLLAGEDEDSARVIAESLGNDSVSVAGPSGTTLIQIDTATAVWHEEVGTLAVWFESVDEQLRALDEASRQAVAFDNWNASAGE